MNYKKQIQELLKDPMKLKQKKPFTRGADDSTDSYGNDVNAVNVGETIEARLPNYRRFAVSQEQFMRELDPRCHDVLFNENLPSICVKTKRGMAEVKFERMAVAFQKLIKGIQLIYLTAHDMDFTLNETNPDDNQSSRFIKLKQMWKKRNQDGMRNKMVDTQMSVGDAGLLYYFDYKGRVKSRILSYADGYVLCPHDDDNGDRILESVYYIKDGVEYIDSYDDKYMYRYKQTSSDEDDKAGWVMEEPVVHGFPEIPLITKRGDVPWNDVQSIIETYEEQYNVFNAIQRRFGWGIFYIKGRFKDEGKRIAGNVVLNDTSLEGKGDAKFLTPPTPQNTIEYLKQLSSTIQLNSQTTFVLPEDIKISGDVSGLAVQVTKELDIQKAMQNVIEWQNVADKMVRLFKFGIAVELVNSGEDPTAVTDFDNLNVTARFKIWRPFNEYEYNQMLATLTGAGILSKESGTELNTVAMPDEKARVYKQVEEEEKKAMQKQEMVLKQKMMLRKKNAEGQLETQPKPKDKE